jgi:L-ascorbate metabolism protein UlaG (beta-lactamase superfamily)
MGTKLTWLSHSGFIIETGEHTFLIDPFLTGNPLAPMAAEDINGVDYILLSHGHGDHVGDTVDIAMDNNATVLGNFEVGNWIQAQGVENVTMPNTGGTIELDFGSVKLTLAFHSSSMPDGSYGGSPNGLLIRLNNGLTIYHAGDTALFSDMQLIGEAGIDVAIVPIGDYYTMGPDDSVRAINWLEPGFVLPVHYNTFPVIEQDAASWANTVTSETAAQPVVLDPGSSHEFAK